MSHLFCVLLVIQEIALVQPPVSPVKVAPGSNATLYCSFSASESLNITTLIINWQYGETVVHSFYLGRDQLERQGTTYSGRTHLFKDELLKGNASLLLTDVRPEDEGQYTCHVNNEQGSFTEKLRVILAATFDEPQLSLQPTCEGFNITVTLSNGYPKPEIRWHDSSGRELDQTGSSVQQDTRGLYQVSSTINFRSNSTETITVEIKLGVLSQAITRALQLHPSPDHCQECCQMPPTSRDRTSIAISFLMLFVVLFVLLILFKMNFKKTSSDEHVEQELDEQPTTSSSRRS